MSRDGHILSPRQTQIIRLVAEGLSNDEVAERLGINPRTAKAHTDSARDRLGVQRRTKLPAAYKEATGLNPFDIPIEESP